MFALVRCMGELIGVGCCFACCGVVMISQILVLRVTVLGYHGVTVLGITIL